MMFWMFVISCVLGLCGAITAIVMTMKGRAGGFALGFFLGPVGLLIAALLPSVVGVEAQHRLEERQKRRRVRMEGLKLALHPEQHEEIEHELEEELKRKMMLERPPTRR
jgi:hypothetical protein